MSDEKISGAVAEFREGITKMLDEFALGPIARQSITSAIVAVAEFFAKEIQARDADIDQLCKDSKRCNATGHPTVTPESLIPCQLERWHDGDHFSSSGCSGGAVTWSEADRLAAS
jgi:hypothetical protein